MRPAMILGLLAALQAVPCVTSAQSRALARANVVDVAGGMIQKNQTMGAFERWEQAIASNSRAPDEWRAVGQALYGAGKYREAIAAFERGLALRASGSSSDAWHVARAYAQLGNRKQALRWLAHARQLGFTDEIAVGREPAFDKYRDEIHSRELVRPSVCHTCRSNPSAERVAARS